MIDDFLEKHSARPGDILVAKHYPGETPIRVFLVTAPADDREPIMFPDGSEPIARHWKPIALYRAPELWDPKWWPGSIEMNMPLSTSRYISVFRIADAQPEKMSLRTMCELVAENAELKAQLAKIREAAEE